MSLRTPGFFLVVGALALLTGCTRQFTRENYDMIHVGSDNREDVRQILGRPSADLSDQWQYDDLKRHYSAIIHFADDGRVCAKEWIDAKTGEWEGRNPNMNEPPAGETRERRKGTTRIDKD